MRKQELGYLIMAVLFVTLVILQFVSDGFWMIAMGILFGTLICTLFSYLSRKRFKTTFSYFVPIIVFIVFGGILLIFAVLDDTWGAIAYAVFGLFFIGSGLFTLPTHLIFDESFNVKETDK